MTVVTQIFVSHGFELYHVNSCYIRCFGRPKICHEKRGWVKTVATKGHKFSRWRWFGGWSTAISLYQLFRYEVQVARFLIRDSRSTFFGFTVLGRVHPHLALTKWAPELGFCAPFDDMKLGTGWKGESWRKLGSVGLSCRFSLIDPPFPMMLQEYVSLCFPYNFSRLPTFPSMTDACQKIFHWTSALSMEFLGPIRALFPWSLPIPIF